MRIRTHAGLVENVTYKVVDGRAVWQGDIDLGPAPPPGLFSDAIKDMSHRWPDGEIHYEIFAQSFQDGQIVTMDPGVRAAIEASVNEYVLRTPLKFVEDSGLSSHPFIRFVPSAFSDGHSASVSVGPSSTDPGEPSVIFIDANGAGVSTALHEVGHSVGFAHEQSRADRDAFLDYDEDCVIADDKSQFDKTGSDFELFGSFDFSSIMLYSSTSFCQKDIFGLSDLDSDCICFPLVKKGTSNTQHSCDATHTTNCTTGFFRGGSDLSGHDVRAVNRMYEPVLGAVEAGDSFGRAIARGDFDGDGIADVAIAAPEETPGGTDATGAVMIYRGTGDGLTAWRLIRESALSSLAANGDEFGLSLAAGDLDGDGKDDLAIGAPNAKVGGGGVRGGAVYVLLGGDGGPGATVAADHTLRFNDAKKMIRLDQNNATDATAETGDQFGASLAIGKIGASMGLAIGVPADNVNGARTGRVNTLTYAGTASGPQFTNRGGVWQSIGAAGDQFGAAVELADFDDDGLGDVAVGVPQRGSGRVIIYRATGSSYASGQVLSAASGDLPGDRFGAALAVGDFDGATYSATGHNKRELAIGAPGRDSGSGRLFVLRPQVSSGALSFTEVTMIGQGTGNNTPGDALGTSLAVGKLGTDSFDDLAAGAPGKDSLGTNTGAVIRYDGSASGIGSPTLVGWVLGDGGTEVPGTNDHAGTAVVIGRFDNDGSGHGDIVTGAPDRKSASGAVLEFDGNALFKYIDEGNAHPE